MKEVLSLIMFGIGALCFAMLIAVVKPTAVTAFPGQGSQTGPLRRGNFAYAHLPPVVFAAGSRADFGHR